MQQTKFSIRWKAVLFLSLVLVAISLSMVTLYAFTLLSESERDAQRSVTQQDQALISLLEDTRDQQIQLAMLLPDLDNVSDAMRLRDEARLQEALGPHWLNLTYNLNLNYLGMFDQNGRTLGVLHHQDQVAAAERDQIAEIARSVAQDMHPHSLLSCTTQCTYFVIEPFITSRDMRGVVVIGRNISELVVSFERLLGIDLGILLAPPESADIDPERLLPNWRLDLWALSNFNEQSVLLSQIQSQSSVPGDSQYDGVVQNRHLRSHVLPIGNLDLINSTPVLIALEDITDSQHLLYKTIREGVLVGVVGWVMAEILLILLILNPTERLARITRALPLLAESDFARARAQIPQRNRYWMRDELDVLEHTALRVCDELEALNQTVEQNTLTLRDQMAEQTRARRFVSNLLDTAPLIILTQTPDGDIQLMNRWGRELIGSDLDESEALKNFADLHVPDTMPDNWQQHIAELIAIEPQQYQHEGQLIDGEGQLRYVTWLHSLVEWEVGQPAILSVGMDLTQRVEAENKLSWLASHDTLTGLHNRHAFQKRLATALARGARGALLFIDADRFKYINDTAGHNVGDSVLVHISQLLEKHTRDTDIVARLGGDEFVVLLPRATAATARAVMAKLSTLLNTHMCLPNGTLQHFSCSLGGAMYPDHGDSDEELLAAADMAMYTAKQQGQGRWHLYDASRAMKDRMQADLNWQDRIRKAMVEDLFCLYFQPILNVTDNSISHYEVLLRMKDENGGVIPPGEFIPVAERTGLISQIDTWVLAESMRFLAEYNDKSSNKPISLAVNVSAPSIQSPTFDRTFFRLCDRHGIKPDQIIIEITETAFLSEFQSALLTLEKLAAVGCRIALDDFGVGFSSFSYLKQMPLSYVKMDGSYVRELERSPQEQVFVKCLTEMVSGFEMCTVAEFVESEAILQVLKVLGVKYAQGYLIGKPSPSIETAEDLNLKRLGAVSAALEEIRE
ncbi:putative bifunctional diguanylate cyclase/phosphodiesterase [Pontibacterium sp.]|uniref:putative bifunctional diguanylate cyclase/phosphodiesterase n=1 Tax=Pontibacterium sp. TaxID=2036026 RepID=UPI003515D41F